MTGRRKLVERKLTRSEIDTHVKAFLQKGGKVITIPLGKCGFKKIKPSNKT